MIVSIAMAAAAMFNLVCQGTETWQGKDRNPFKTIIRVDLNVARWCSDECRSTKPLASATSSQIVFEPDDEDGSGTLHMVNRESGDYLFRVSEGLGAVPILIRVGSCSVAPFSGFPARKF